MSIKGYRIKVENFTTKARCAIVPRKYEEKKGLRIVLTDICAKLEFIDWVGNRIII